MVTINTIETDDLDVPDRDTLPEEMTYNECRLYVYTGTSRMLCCVKSDDMYYCNYGQDERWDDIFYWINEHLGPESSSSLSNSSSYSESSG